MVVRNDIARRYDVPVFHVLSNKSLIDMAKYRYKCLVQNTLITQPCNAIHSVWHTPLFLVGNSIPRKNCIKEHKRVVLLFRFDKTVNRFEKS